MTIITLAFSFENPVVQQEMLKVIKFWLDMGVDGFRCDAVPYLCTNIRLLGC